MLNIIIPIYEPSDINTNSIGILDPVKNKTIFEWSLEHLEKYTEKKRYIIISTDNLISKTHIDKIIELYTESEIKIIKLQKNTTGAPCAILMGIDHYNLEEEFLITSPDQYIDTDLRTHLKLFQDNGSDAGTIGFESIHSKWSYADINEDNNITRIVEKIPISNNALTSTYYFKTGEIMINAISDYILRGEVTNNKYFIAPSFNELIIRNYKILFSKISSEKYYNFYSEDVKKDFVNYLNSKDEKFIKITNKYFEYLEDKNVDNLSSIFSESISIHLSEKKVIKGLNKALDYLKEIFLKDEINFSIDKITKNDEESTYCNYSLSNGSIHYDFIDKITFNKINDKIKTIKRYSLDNNAKVSSR